jgi:hypothetical protein
MALQRWIFGLSSFAIGAVVIALESDLRTAGDHSGYAPDQPIAYSHRLHAGELQIACTYCHYGAQTSRHAGIPSATICMNCHKVVTAGFDAVLAERAAAEAEKREARPIESAELRKLYDALALDAKLEPIPGREPRAVPWQRVHALPDFVYFDHRAHVTRGVACESCHGPVQAMERMRQDSTLSMGWCIACHRASSTVAGTAAGAPDGPRVAEHVSTDCVSCHY